MKFFETASKWQIEGNSVFHVADRTINSSEVVQTLAPHLTDERKARIDAVINQRTFRVATVVEHLYDIGNISAVMRSAESFGFLPFHIIERPGAKYKMSDRISRGSEKWLDIHRHSSTQSCLAGLRSAGFRIYAADLQAATVIDGVNVDAQKIFNSPKVAVVFGNERDGITSEAREMVDGCFKLSMHGFAQSFNISVAAALTFQIVYQARARAETGCGDLSLEEKLAVRAHYYLRTLDGAEQYFR